MDWYETLVEGIEGMPRIRQDQIFQFHGKGDTPTQTEDFVRWVVGLLPPPPKYTNLKRFEYENYLAEGEASANEQVRQAAAAERELFEKMLNDQAAGHQALLKQMSEEQAQERMEAMKQL